MTSCLPPSSHACSPGSQSAHNVACAASAPSPRETRKPSWSLPSFPDPAGRGPGGSQAEPLQLYSPADLALGPACMALSSWSMGWLDREKIQISATLTDASLMLLQRLSTWPPSEGCCITWGQGSALEGAKAQGQHPAAPLLGAREQGHGAAGDAPAGQEDTGRDSGGRRQAPPLGTEGCRGGEGLSPPVQGLQRGADCV